MQQKNRSKKEEKEREKKDKKEERKKRGELHRKNFTLKSKINTYKIEKSLER